MTTNDRQDKKVKVPVKRRGAGHEASRVGPINRHGNKWAKSVRSWIVEFQKRDRSEALPAFDSLFKGADRIRGCSIDTDRPKKGKMKAAILKIVTHELPTTNRGPATIEDTPRPPINAIVREPRRARRGRHLDVDAVLARSLPNVVSE